MQYATPDTQNEGELNLRGYRKLIAWQKADILAHLIAEVEYLLDFAYKRRYITKDNFNNVLQLRNEVGQLVWRL